MKLVLPHIYKGKIFLFSFFFGVVYSKKKGSISLKLNRFKNKKIKKAISIVENPFLVKTSIELPEKNQMKNNKWIKLYAKIIMFFGRYFRSGLFILSNIRISFFNNTTEAIDYFCKLYPIGQQYYCLSRSIFAATTSKTFKENGVVFIGIFHPSHHMHAWIIEGDKNTYRYDSVWINFEPIAIIV